jgi:protease secretion system outer membrane protein
VNLAISGLMAPKKTAGPTVKILPKGSGKENAKASSDKAAEALRAAQETAAIEAQRLLRTAQSLDTEVEIRVRAVAAARLALEGNIKSYQGGVKSNIDVLTSIQNLSDTEVALANSQISRLETLLNIQLLDPAEVR